MNSQGHAASREVNAHNDSNTLHIRLHLVPVYVQHSPELLRVYVLCQSLCRYNPQTCPYLPWAEKHFSRHFFQVFKTLLLSRLDTSLLR
jgi:hypothetical protein